MVYNCAIGSCSHLFFRLPHFIRMEIMQLFYGCVVGGCCRGFFLVLFKTFKFTIKHVARTLTVRAFNKRHIIISIKTGGNSLLFYHQTFLFFVFTCSVSQSTNNNKKQPNRQRCVMRFYAFNFPRIFIFFHATLC